MQQQNNIPTLRFPGFEGKWKEKDLGELCSTFKSGNGITSKYIKEGGTYPVYGGNGLRGFTESYTHDGFYVLIGRQGALCGNITRVYGKTFISEHAVAVQTNSESDPEWLAQKLDFMNLNQYSESSAQPGLAVNKLVKLKIKSPSLPEQQKIASFFTAIDKKITQLKQQKEKLELYKKGVMQQIFGLNHDSDDLYDSGDKSKKSQQSKKSTFRRLRFKTDDGKDFPKWEKKKLGDIARFSKGKGISKSDISDAGKFECIRYGELYTHYQEIIFEIKSRTDYANPVLSETNDIIIPSSGETQIDIAKASCILKSGVALGGDLNIIKTDNNGVFLSYYLNNKRKNNIANLAQGISVVHLYADQLARLDIEVPSLEEQTKIANFLSTLDEKINNVQAQIQQTVQWKKGLLQRMFV